MGEILRFPPERSTAGKRWPTPDLGQAVANVVHRLDLLAACVRRMQAASHLSSRQLRREVSRTRLRAAACREAMKFLSDRKDGADLAQLESVWTSLSPSLHAMVVASIAICESASSPIEQYELRMRLVRLSSAIGDGLARARASALAALPSEPGTGQARRRISSCE